MLVYCADHSNHANEARSDHVDHTVPRLEAVRLKDLCFLMTARIGVALGFQVYSLIWSITF